MKTLSLLLATTIGFAAFVNSQNYLIGFTGSGLSTSVDSVLAVNLTTGDSLMINGSDMLHLVPFVGINQPEIQGKPLSIFPNPVQQSAVIEIFNYSEGHVNISITDVAGKRVLVRNFHLPQGGHTFSVSGLGFGFYLVSINTSRFSTTASLVSVSAGVCSPQLVYTGTTGGMKQTKSASNPGEIIPMLYAEGERLLLKGMFQQHARIIALTATQNETIDFEFIVCVDAGGTHYPVVTIGEQTWMAKNLAWLPAVSHPDESSFSVPHYYVYGYYGNCADEAKASENYQNYGVLYNWTSALTACPAGWHLPDDNEWKILEGYTDSQFGIGHPEWNGMFWRGFDTGKHLKSTSVWLGNGHGNNEYAFTAQPGGYYTTVVPFSFIELYGRWWTSGIFTSTTAWSRTFYSSINNSNRYYYPRSYGFSVRCVKD